MSSPFPLGLHYTCVLGIPVVSSHRKSFPVEIRDPVTSLPVLTPSRRATMTPQTSVVKTETRLEYCVVSYSKLKRNQVGVILLRKSSSLR